MNFFICTRLHESNIGNVKSENTLQSISYLKMNFKTKRFQWSGQITKKVLDKLIKAPGAVVNIPEIIQNVELRSQHKTAAYAFRHNERSQQYYTARGKVRKPSDLSETPKSESMRRDSLPQEETENLDTVPVQHDLKLEQVSPKIDTPPDTG